MNWGKSLKTAISDGGLFHFERLLYVNVRPDFNWNTLPAAMMSYR
jgi:hypothetical protein